MPIGHLVARFLDMQSEKLQGSADAVAHRRRMLSDAAGESERRSEEHTSELQSPYDLVCRLLLEKKKQKKQNHFLNAVQKPVHWKFIVIFKLHKLDNLIDGVEISSRFY